jgi:hypothetical protein
LPTASAQETTGGVARDPLANLKRLDENRPGFHWRATQRLKESDVGSEELSDKASDHGSDAPSIPPRSAGRA